MNFLKTLFTKRFILFFLVFGLALGIFLRGGGQVGAATTTNQSVGNISSAQNQSFINALQSPGQTLESWITGKELVGIPQAGMIPIMLRGLTGYLWGIYNPDGTPVSTGAMGTLDTMVAGLYNYRPVSSFAYFNNLAENIGIIKPTYAASLGATFLNPVFAIWQKTRDISYVFFVVIFVAIGFMIMFRFKINPQTVASIQDSIPKIVVALILVTLSFAIAGFIVDLVFLGNLLIYNSFNAAPFPNWITADKFTIITLFQQWGSVTSPLPGGVGSCSGIICLVGVKLATAIPSLISGNVADLVDFLLALVVVATVFKIFFSLLTKYVTIFISTIFAPFAFLWGALPGQEDTGAKLIKGLVSAALTFPVIYFFMNLALYFVQVTTPPLSALPPFSLDVGAGKTLQVAAGYRGLIALGLLMAASGAPQAIDDILAVKPGAGAGAAEGIAGAIRKLPIIGSFLG